VWVSGDVPASTHDTAAAWLWTILAALRGAGLIVAEGRQPGSRPAARPLGERAHAQLKSWGLLRKLRCCPRRAGPGQKPATSYRTPRSPKDEKGTLY